jgi:hypothetical protein
VLTREKLEALYGAAVVPVVEPGRTAFLPG